MGKVATEIVGKDAKAIVDELNKALADEWLAYLQYMLGSRVVDNTFVSKELEEVAEDELEHSEELTDRIIKLGGEPIVDPKKFYVLTNCGYEVPSQDSIKALVAGAKGEGCAIKVYSKIAAMAKDKDVITYNLVLHIMEEEEGHEQKFENLLVMLRK